MDARLLTLKWNNHKRIFFKTISKFRSQATYTDVTLACDSHYYQVHKIVLSSCSEYFEELFENTHCKCPVIVLKDIRPSDLEALLNYIYVGEVEVKQDDLPELIKAAECLKIKGLAYPDDVEDKSLSKNIKKRKNAHEDQSLQSINKSLKTEDSEEKDENPFLKGSNSKIFNEVKKEPLEDEIVQVQDENKFNMIHDEIDLEEEHYADEDSMSDQLLFEPTVSTANTPEQPSGESSSVTALDVDESFIVFENGTMQDYKCEYCDYASSSKSSMKAHCITHNRQKPFKCNVCPYQSSWLGNLKTHIRKHIGEKPFACPYCSFRSIQSCSVRRHVIKKHPNELNTKSHLPTSIRLDTADRFDQAV